MKTKTKKEYCQWHETMETPAECATKPTTEATHTPTPWNFVDTAMQTPTGVEIHRWFHAGGLPLPLTDANAAFIVRAVNSHAALLEAAKDACKWIESHETNGTITDNNAYWNLRNAIAQAEGDL